MNSSSLRSSGAAGVAGGGQVVIPSLLALMVVVLCLSGAALGGGANPARAAHGGAHNPYLEPDLVTLPPTSLSVTKRRLHFGTLIANRGEGPLEIRPGFERVPCGVPGRFQRMGFRAPQAVYLDVNQNGVQDPDETDFETVDADTCIVYHKPHGHYHYRDFSRYLLKRIRNGRARQTASVGRKVSFCVIDTDHAFPEQPGSPAAPTYGRRRCIDPRRGTPMGISVGWGDHYPTGLAGQWLRIRDLPRGRYCLILRANPKRFINEVVPFEGGDDPNASRTKLRLDPAGGTVSRLTGEC